MKTSHDTDMAQKLLSAIADSIHTSDCIRLLIAEGVLGLDDLQLMRDIIVLSKAERSAARDAAALMVPLLLAEREGSLCYTLEQKRIEDLCMRALRLRADADDSAETDEDTDEDTDENDGNAKLSEAALRAAASSFAEEAIQSAGRALAQNASPLIAYVRGAESAHEPLSPIVVYAPLDGSAQAPKVYWQRYFSAERALERAFQARAKNAADSPSGENAASAMPPASGNADAASRGAPQKMAACALRAGAFQDMELNEEQKRALSCALRAKTLIISGGPGTGKTTTVAAILRALFAAGLCNASTVLLAAPTGRAAQRMQDYISRHINEEIALDGICQAAGYSKRHAFRLFKEVFNKTPFEYIRALRLTQAAQAIRSDAHASITEVAMHVGFNSHEGFTKAFKVRFNGVCPSQYRAHLPMAYAYFKPAPVLKAHLLRQSKEFLAMAESQRTVTVTVVEKPARKLVLMQGKTAWDYFSLNEEIGCDKWELLAEHPTPGAIDDAALVILPPHMVKPGTAKAAFGREVPADYSGTLPAGFDIIDLPACTYLWFTGAPYADDDWYGQAYGELFATIESYKPERFGYAYAKDEAPEFNHGSSAEGGTRVMVPVKKLPKG